MRSREIAVGDCWSMSDLHSSVAGGWRGSEDFPFVWIRVAGVVTYHLSRFDLRHRSTLIRVALPVGNDPVRSRGPVFTLPRLSGKLQGVATDDSPQVLDRLVPGK
jgi:hypothetical protein